MAALKEDRSYGLSCGRVSDGSKVSVFHVKLTDSALRAFESYRSSQFPSCPGVTVSHSQKRSLFFRRASSPLVKRIPQDEAKVPLQVRRRWWGHCVQLKSPFLVAFQSGVFSLGSSDLSCRKAGFPRNSWGRAHESCK
uniref:Elongation factor for RNA polymerase II n=1 Tax=Lynx canadensis TaxID=61383 RepID=A0A667HF33_LYNCA